MAQLRAKCHSYTVAYRLDSVRRIKTDFAGNLSAASRQLNVSRKQLREWTKQETDFANADKLRTKRHIGRSGRTALVPMVPRRETRETYCKLQDTEGKGKFTEGFRFG
jgi:hypothetical protein